MKKILFLLLFPVQVFAQPSKSDISRWQQQASRVTIIRDNWGIPHIYGKTDADAVFGLMYAQCEDDFPRVEMNYLEKLGELSMVKGEAELYNDLLIRMVIDQDAAKADYKKAPEWLKKLCDAFADGINYYLYKNPGKSVSGKPFEPWYPFLWTDGSIGAINTAGISVSELKSFYSDSPAANASIESEEGDPGNYRDLTGSNGFAFSPKITESGSSILYINPHVTFYFRPEVHMVSEEGLNAYGAVTWGQFFIYQGFNEHCGWMHTSSGVDAADAYIEKLSQKNGKWYYEYNGALKPVITKKITLRIKDAGGKNVDSKTFNAMFTHHGPVMAKRNGQWLSMKADNRLMNGLIQCWQRTKAKSFTDYKKTQDLKGNISNNTVYADAEGNIAYWHGNRVPARDSAYDWSKPVDGSIRGTEWKGYHEISETVLSINPPNGWLQNCNSTPFTVAGYNSPLKKDYPAYMAPDGENFRGLNAVRTLSEEKSYTIDKVIKAGYDTRLVAFEILVPALLRAFDKNPVTDSFNAKLAEPVSVLKTWNFRCSDKSIATTLAIEWGQKLFAQINRVAGVDQVERTRRFVASASVQDLLQPLELVIRELQSKFGRWQVPWGEINRFQRISSDIDNKFDDNKPSIPVGFVSSQWGMLPSYSSRSFPGTQKRYGVNGNSFICAVEFGKRIKAKALLAGGQSGNEQSKHFFDQGLMYSKGEFRDVLFYKEDVLKNAEKTYHPGELP